MPDFIEEIRFLLLLEIIYARMYKVLKSQHTERTTFMKRTICIILTVLLLAALLAGCTTTTGTFTDSNSTPTNPSESQTKPTESDLDLSLVYFADIIIQDYGTITVQLAPESAPATVANFVTLAQSGFYDGLTFHRIIENFMMQGGDPLGNGTGNSGTTIPGEFQANGFDNPLTHSRGAVSMARSKLYDSASCQFFIVHKDYPSLDGLYAVFGYVTEGIDVVDAVCEAANPIDKNGKIATEDQPVITSVTIRTKPKAE